MNIIISGANGFVGKELFNHLKAKTTNNVLGIVRNNNDLSNDHFSVDLIDRKSVNEFVEKIKSLRYTIESFVHCASLMADVENAKNIDLLKNNNLITENIIFLTNQLGIKNLINLSSIAIYPNVDGEYFEDSFINPSKNGDCIYGLSKFCAEQLFNFLINAEVTKLVHLRVSQVLGENMRTDRTYKIMEDEMKKTNRITVWAKGERVSNFIDIKDVIKTIEHFLNYPYTGTFNVGSENLSYQQLAEKVILENKFSNVEILLLDKGAISKVFINTDKLKAHMKNL